MPEDEERREVVYEHAGNATRSGRYMGAPEDGPHLDPEVPPLGSEDVESEPPPAVPGALPENEGRRGETPSRQGE